MKQITHQQVKFIFQTLTNNPQITINYIKKLQKKNLQNICYH